MSLFSHGPLPSTPQGVRRRRSEEETSLPKPLLQENEQRAFVTTESPNSHRTIKKSRATDATGDDLSGSSTTISSVTTASGSLPPPVKDTPVLPSSSKEAPPLADDSPVSHINNLLTQALLLAIGGAAPSNAEHVARSRQLVRTLASYFDVATSQPPEAVAPTSALVPERESTYAAAAKRPLATTKSSSSATKHNSTPLSSQPHTTPSRKVNTGRAQSQRQSLLGSHRVVVRFISPSTGPKLGEDLSGLYEVLHQKLGCMGIPIRAIHPTRSGNLVIHTFDAAAAARLRQAESQVHTCLQMEYEGWYGSITLEEGSRWSSIVVHDVPLQSFLSYRMGQLDLEGSRDRFLESVRKGGNVFADLTSCCPRVTALSRREDLEDNGEDDMRRISVRMDLAEENLASQILRQGVYIGGQYCRVSRYKARQRALQDPA